MYVLSVLEHSLNVEKILLALEAAGIPKTDVLASSIEKEKYTGRFFDTMHSYNTKSQFDLPMILAVVLSLLGCIYGFALRWGPVSWGVIGALLGFGTGLLMKYLMFKKRKDKQTESEVFILVSCDETKADRVKTLLGNNGALGLSTI